MEGRESIPISGMAYSRPARPPRTFPSLPGSLLPNSSHVICFAGLSILDPHSLPTSEMAHKKERTSRPSFVVAGGRRTSKKWRKKSFMVPSTMSCSSADKKVVGRTYVDSRIMYVRTIHAIHFRNLCKLHISSSGSVSLI